MTEPIEIIDDDDVVCENIANAIPINNSDNSDNPDNIYFAKRTKRDNVLGPWKACKLLDKVESTGNNNDHVVQFFNDHTKKDVAEYELAHGQIPSIESLLLRTRVIAARRNEDIPYKLDESGERVMLYASNSKELYPGIIASWHETDGRYLVFFDDGMVQYIPRAMIRRVLGNDEYKHAHWNAKRYFQFLFEKRQWELKLSEADLDKRIEVELNGKWEKVELIKLDGSLALIHFESVNRYEWIYLGSPRFSKIYRRHITEKHFDGEIQFKTYQACLSARICDDVTVIDLVEPDDDSPQSSSQSQASLNINLDSEVDDFQPVTHTCGPPCIRENGRVNEDDVDIERYSALQRPMLVGWARLGKKPKYYRAPCGIDLRSYKDIDKYLAVTNSKLRIDCFDRNELVQIPAVTAETNDISRGKEKVPIAVRGEQMIMEFTYITDHNFEYIDVEPQNNLGRVGCNCEDNCRDKWKCSCWKLTVQLEVKRTLLKKQKLKIGYENMKLQEMVSNGIVECGNLCRCCAAKCSNHVVQNGIQHKFEIFKTANKGWGVRATTDLPKGAFICHYAGDVLEENAADQRDTRYQFKLPKFKRVRDVDTSDIESSNESDSDADAEPVPKIRRNDDVLQPFLNYFPPMHNGNADHFPEEYIEWNENMGTFVVDGLKNGNISRFINHSCEPNLMCQKVFASDDKRFPLIAFFANRLIKAGEEITIDYRYDRNDEKATPCHCGAPKCAKRLI